MEQALQNEIVGMTLDDMTIPDLGFYDDICLLDDNSTDAQKLLDKVTSNAAMVGFHLMPTKPNFEPRTQTVSPTFMMKN